MKCARRVQVNMDNSMMLGATYVKCVTATVYIGVYG